MANSAVWQVSSGFLSLLRVLRLLRTQCTIKRTEGARLLSALVVQDAARQSLGRVLRSSHGSLSFGETSAKSAAIRSMRKMRDGDKAICRVRSLF